MKKTININVPVLARVEGEGALELSIHDNQITHLQLKIYEPPRFFEKFLQGRNYYDVLDAVARICGICPVAYQMSATHAIESVFNIKSTPWLRAMRRLFYCGEWLQSHSLHIHMLAAPDYLGYNSVIEMSAEYMDEVRRGFKLQALGNDLVSLFGARSVHPVGVKIGGFTKAPAQAEIDELLRRVIDAKQDAIDLIHWVDAMDLPEDNQTFTSVALHRTDEYPFNEGRIISDNGLNIDISDYKKHFEESQVAHSTALHSKLDGKPYLVGPLARLNLNKNQLPDEVKNLMQELNTQFPSKNMFHSIVARAIEIYYTLVEAEHLLTDYKTTDEPCLSFEPQAGTGYGCSEAPRGILWHEYEIDDNGIVIKADIIPPTSQNQLRIEEDLKQSLISFGLDKSKEELQLHAEKVIRNYDPCISCATHFLDLKLIRNSHEELAGKTAPKNTYFNNIELASTAILGIGSYEDGDNAGLNLIDSLNNDELFKNLKKKGLSLLKLERPGISLNEHIKKYKYVIIVDTIKSANDTTELTWININQLDNPGNRISSHELGVIDSLTWLSSVGELPNNITLLGMSSGTPLEAVKKQILKFIQT